ncbi:MAG TPA: SET domain-containing protein [Gemmatimonadaceae bacterium]|nr:SET domain-containing protein [Gemmatimonadaceae bacterium]
MPHPLLTDLAHRTYCVLRPSPIAGVGVFAIRDIPKGCRDMFSPPGAPDDYVAVPRAEVDALPAYARHLVENFCLYDAEWYWIPRDGFKKLDLSHFLNHSDSPNVASIDEGQWFEALRDIAAGEELTVDYGELVEDEERS